MNAVLVPPGRVWWLAAAFIVWCVALVVLYALHAIGCAFGWPTGALRWSLMLVFIAHLVVIGWMWSKFARGRPDPATGSTGSFLYEAILWTVITAFASTVLVLGPPLLLSTCI
ncbi:hypothetical protein VAR608DRAFT_1886 [Variovorax sp. HW608]|uniref:hypothetical protein n=1 Tax=Variovorax sp. HW608 TaxID=1034889 RepID=UPI00081F8658|nr:hypothetical protein [Variovorax sp. HW608]SCK23877.1 hypothetical protein VAR608DRAFT_1886 [Variovorax sp. HW608]